MKKIAYCLLLLSTQIIFGQNPLAQEDKIYNAVDIITANPTKENLQKLEATEKEFWKNPKPKTKNELLAIVVLNCNKAYYENQFGQSSQAISSYEKAWQIYQKHQLSNYDITEYCLKPLGNLYTLFGDYDNAENTIKQYYYLANLEKNESQKISAILNLSNVYQNTARVNEAIDLLEKTIKIEKLTAIQKGTLLNNLGNNYLLSSKGFLINPESFSKAERCFKSTIQLLKNEKDQSQTLANCYLNLTAFNSHWRNFDKANEYFSIAKKLVLESKNKNSKTIAKLYFEEAKLLFQQHKTSESSAKISTVFKFLVPNYSDKTNLLPNSKSLYAETILLDAIDLQADIYSEQNQPKKALAAFDLSYQIEDLFADLLVYEQSKIINQIRIRNRTEKCISIYDSLYRIENKNTYLEKAFQLQERTKSGVLRSYLSHKKTASKEENNLLNQLQNCNNEILKEQQKGKLAKVPKINEAIKEQNELMLILKQNRIKNNVNTSENLDLKSLFTKLEKDKSIMVEYFSGLDKMYIFTIENQKIKLDYYWDNHTATPNIISFLNYFSDSNKITDNISGYNHRGNSVYKMLKLPSTSNYKNLIIIPDGILNFLPFEALITQESTTTNFAKMHYLFDDFNIAYSNSASFYLNAKPSSNHNKTVLGIFPVFEKTPYELTFSKKEMQSIKSNFDGKYFENTEATFDNFKNNADNYSILHLSTHASSGDTQMPASIKFYDQEILYSQLYNLNINPDLVVLSACETGIGKLFLSEGAMSIARGFQGAGAQNLLFSLWKVNDYTTSVFMDYFYMNIKKEIPYFEANAIAKRDFLSDKTISNSKKSPYYWSAFVYYGELKTNESSTNYYYFYILGIFIVGGLFWFFMRFRKQKPSRIS